MDFKTIVTIDSVVIDWETAHATEYRLEGRQSLHEEWEVFYNGSETLERDGYSVQSSMNECGL